MLFDKRRKEEAEREQALVQLITRCLCAQDFSELNEYLNTFPETNIYRFQPLFIELNLLKEFPITTSNKGFIEGAINNFVEERPQTNFSI